MSWECVFSPQFKKGCAKLPSHIQKILNRETETLKADPFQRNPHVKPLRGYHSRYRLQIGKSVRVIYRVDQKRRSIVLLCVGFRGSIYKQTMPTWSPTWELQLNPTPNPAPKTVPSDHATPPRKMAPVVAPLTELTNEPMTAEVPSLATPGEEEVVIELLEWITEEELYLLEIPDHLWPEILLAGKCDALEVLKLPPWVKWRIADYFTNVGTQIDKLYTLGPQDDMETVAHKPLRAFTLRLDPDQKLALQRLNSDGPYLIKGSAGTGKTLVGLYHIRDLIVSRAAESMFEKKVYGVLTYTNTLADANLAALTAITPASAHNLIHSATLDSVSFGLVCSGRDDKPNLLSIKGMSKWIREDVLDNIDLPKEVRITVESLGTSYVAEEIEQVINGNGLTSPNEYVEADRRGRKRPLRASERQQIWLVHTCLQEVCRNKNTYTWEESHQVALRHLQSNPNLPRYSALFVDEAQDLSKVSRLLCLALVRSPKFLVLAADTAQSIYTIPVSWKSVHPAVFANLSRRSVMLTRGYRSTQQISDAINPLRFDPGDDDDRALASTPVFRGPKPKWHRAPLENHSAIVCNEISTLTAKPNDTSLGQIAIIVRTFAQAKRYRSALEACGIESHIVQKRSPINLDAHHVHIMTAHASKGFGFPIAIVPEVSSENFPYRPALERAKDDEQREQVKDQEKRLLYVAVSRASRRLFLLTDPNKPCELLAVLRSDDWDS